MLVLSAALAALCVALAYIYAALQPPKLAVPPQKNLTLSNLTIWNPGSDKMVSQTLNIKDGLITDIRPSQGSDTAGFCDGCFAMPGLIDAHVHTPPSIAIGNRELFSLLYLRHGVTSIRDLGQLDADLPDLVDRIASGKLAGPRMYRCGPILDGDPPSVPGAVLVKTAAEGRRAVDDLAASGVNCIKIYGNLSPDAFKGVSGAARNFGLPLIGHTPNSLSFNDIQNFESQHHTGIPYLTKPAPKDRAYKSQDMIDMSPADMDAVIQVMLDNKITFLPTNANGMSRLTVSDPARFPASEGFKHLPEFWEIAWPSIISHPETDAEIATELEALPVTKAFMRKARERGVDVLAGTDVIMPYVIPGESIYQQLGIMADAFGSNPEALKAATRINGRHIDRGKIGEITIGAYADLLLFSDDPGNDMRDNISNDLAAILNWDYAILDGRVYERGDVEAAVEKFDRHFRGRLYSKVMGTAYGFLASDYEDSEVSKHE